MSALALVLPYNIYKKKVGVDEGHSNSFPKSDWFSGLLKQHGLEDLVSSRKQPASGRTAQNERPVSYLVKLVADVEYSGPLTVLDEQCKFLWEYFNYPADAYTVRVARCFKYATPVFLGFDRHRLNGLVCEPGVPTADLARAQAACVSDREQKFLSGEDLQHALGISDQQFAEFLANPIIFRRAWSLVEADAASLLADSQSCGSATIAFGDEEVEERQAETFEWEQLVCRLDSFVASLGGGRKVQQGFAHPSLGKGNRFDIATMVSSLAAAMHLRNRTELRSTVQNIVESLFSPIDFDSTVWEKIPSGPTLSRSQLLIDAALCGYMRERFSQHDFVLYLLADSSPQAGHDYLLSTAVMIRRDELQKCADAAKYMRASWDDFVSAYKNDDHNKMKDIATSRQLHGCTLKSCILTHRLLPMAMGSGASGLDHKASALARSLFAETQSLPDLQRVLSQVVSFTTDMGTEFSIADMAGLTLKEILPSWASEGQLERDFDDCEAEPLPPQAQADSEGYFLPRAITVPGLNHVIDNMLSDMNQAFSCWDSWIGEFKPLVALLHHTHLRQRFVATCLKDTRHSWMQRHFETGVPQYADWRWGTTVLVLQRLLPLRRLLQSAWDPNRYESVECHEAAGAPENPAAQDARADAKADVQQVTRAIRSDWFWNFASMVFHLNSANTEFLSWVEGCPCHPWGRNSQSSRKDRREPSPAQQLEQDALVALTTCCRELGLPGDGDGQRYLPCPLAGLRSCELASGSVQEQMLHLVDMCKEDLLLELSPMPQDEIDEILLEFDRGKNYLIATFTNKFQHWGMLPWQLAALANPDEAKARTIAADFLDKFDASEQTPELHHRLTWSWLRESPNLRASLAAFVSGQALDSLPELHRAAFELSFIPTVGVPAYRRFAIGTGGIQTYLEQHVCIQTHMLEQVERRQEGDHSLIKRGASLRKVLKIFESGPGELSSSFVSEFARILHPDDMARKLGFYRHPLYAEAVQDKASFHDKRKLAGVYMYSLDIVSQYTMQKAKQKKREQRAAKKARVVEKWKKSNAAAQSFSGDVVEREALADHLQSVVAEGGSNVLFSVPRAQSRQSMPVRSLQASLVPRVRAVSQLQLEVDGESVLSDAADSADAVADSSDLTFFQVLPLQLHRQKLVQMPAASARRLTQHDVCVTLHDSRRSNGRYVVAVEASRATSVQSPVAVLSVCDAEVGAIRTQLTSWNRRKSGSCILEGVAGVVVQRAEEAIRKLMACRAFPNTGNVLQLAKSDAQMLQQLESLRDCSVVECLEDGPENSKWCFSLAGAGKLRVATDARCPELVFKPLADLSLECLESGTCWQLYQALQQKGFQVKQRPKSKKAVRQLAPLTPESAGADLVWYLSGTSMLRARKYMITLIRAEEMFASGGLSRVYHCQPVQYYSAVLHEGHTGSPFQAVADEPVAALQLDVEQAPGPQALLDAGSQEPAVPSRPSKRARRAPVADAVPPASSAFLDPAVPPDQTSDAPQALPESDSGLSSESLSLAAQFWTESENEDVAQLAQEHVQAEGGENEVGSETPARTPPGAGALDSPLLSNPGTPASPRESADDRAALVLTSRMKGLHLLLEAVGLLDGTDEEKQRRQSLGLSELSMVAWLWKQMHLISWSSVP
ncbi:unnamed protein product, partial [Symbiodinium necroappetens]